MVQVFALSVVVVVGTVVLRSDATLKMDAITDTTPYSELPPDMQIYIKKIFVKKKTLDGIGSGPLVQWHRCYLQVHIDILLMKYLLKMWSSKEIRLPRKNGKWMTAELPHNWYVPVSATVYRYFSCVFQWKEKDPSDCI